MFATVMARINPQIVIASTLGVIFQIALTILAWGDWNSFFDHPARTGLVIGSVLLTIAAWFSGTSGISSGKSHSPASKRIIFPFMVVIFAVILIAPFSDRHNLWTIGGNGTRYLGLALFGMGSIIRLVAVFALGRRFSGLVAIQPNHKLKTDGIYSHVRHPSYTGFLLAMIGWVLVFRSTLGLVLNIILLLLLLSRIADEEEFLEAEFALEYRTYREKTWRLIPFIY
jgi:protein-S-isoprenylcysteine O-methyltransferase Ste14